MVAGNRNERYSFAYLKTAGSGLKKRITSSSFRKKQMMLIIPPMRADRDRDYPPIALICAILPSPLLLETRAMVPAETSVDSTKMTVTIELASDAAAD